MAMTPEQREIVTRRRIFERHIADCDYCNAPVSDQPGGSPALLCMSGAIMLAHYVRTIQNKQPPIIAPIAKSEP